jgi:opacity protein-like surface antigen
LFVIALLTVGIRGALAQAPGYYSDGSDYYGGPHFYLGADAGQSTVRNDTLGFDQHGFGFDLRAGVRPIPYLGAEIEYVDLGNQHDLSDCFRFCSSGTHVESQGGAAFGVAYLPIPHSLVDLYGKAGVARLQTRTTSLVSPNCPPNQPCPLSDFIGSYRTDTTDTDFAWGAGMQLHWWNFAFRGEFQQFQTRDGHPSLVSAGVSWTFW